jgi:O-antigen/teichoic acid export membrane protein
MMIGLRLADRLISVVSFSILARLLTPEDYGVYALAFSVMGILGLAGAWGFDTAVVQRRGFDRGHYDTAWTVRIIAAALVAVLICAAATTAVRIFAEPRIGPVLYWLALATFIASLENIGTLDFMKTLEYRRELAYRLTIRVMVTTFAVVLAFAWHSYWALVAGYVAANSAMVALSYRVHPYRPRLSLSHVSALFKFTRWVFLRNIVQGMNDNVPNVILGRVVGVAQLSFFTLARDLSVIVVTDLYAPIRRALFPAYASVNDDIAALKRLTVDSSALMMLIGLPLSVGLAVVAPDAVHVLLGDRWLPVIPLLQILCISGCVGSGIAGAPVLFLAMGRPDTIAKIVSFRLIVVCALLTLGATTAGTLGAAWAMLATACIMQVVNWRIVSRSIGVSGKELRQYFARPVTASAIMAVVVLALQDVLPEGLSLASSLLRLVGGIVTGGLAYGLALLMLWRLAGKPDGAERHVLDLLAAIGKRIVVWRARVSGSGS